MKCPRCPRELSPFASRGVDLDQCLQCDGIWFDRDELAKFNRFDSDFPLRADKPVAGKFTTARCPRCNSYLSITPYTPDGSLQVHRCISCAGVWLDGGTIDAVRRLLTKEIKGRRKMRTLDETVRREQEMWQSYTAGVADQEKDEHPSTMQWLFLFLTRLPVEVHNPVRNVPWATIALIAVNAALWATQNFVAPQTVLQFMLIPNELRQFMHPYTLVTAMFLHAGPVHLVANLYFFYTFGDNVEDFLGPKVFVFLYLVSGLAGNLAHFAANMHSTIPTLGASGAISGVFATYMLLYPRRRIYFMLIVWPMKIRAVWYGLGWVGSQVLFAMIGGSGGVAWWGHIGGFAAGAIFVTAYFKYRRIHPATAHA